MFQPCGGLKVVEANLSLSKNNIVKLVILLKLYGQTRQKKKKCKMCLFALDIHIYLEKLPFDYFLERGKRS